MESGVVLNVMSFSTRDGPGIRTTVFLKGCPLNCLWCHNPESQKPRPELMLRPNLCIGCGACLEVCPEDAVLQEDGVMVTLFTRCTACGECVAVCCTNARELVGETMDVKTVMRRIHRDIPFFDESNGGVTFSGGEPFMQPDFLLALLKECRRQELHTAVDTSAYTSWTVLDRVREWVDLFLIDVKSMDEMQHKCMTGVSNTPILANVKQLVELGHNVLIRVPLVPGVNADAESMRLLGRFCQSLAHPVPVELLPYHRSGVEKYRRLGRNYDLEEVIPLTEEEVKSLADILREEHITVQIGG